MANIVKIRKSRTKSKNDAYSFLLKRQSTGMNVNITDNGFKILAPRSCQRVTFVRWRDDNINFDDFGREIIEKKKSGF